MIPRYIENVPVEGVIFLEVESQGADDFDSSLSTQSIEVNVVETLVDYEEAMASESDDESALIATSAIDQDAQPIAETQSTAASGQHSKLAPSLPVLWIARV